LAPSRTSQALFAHPAEQRLISAGLVHDHQDFVVSTPAHSRPTSTPDQVVVESIIKVDADEQTKKEQGEPCSFWQ
jgi:hypothetical protein